MTALQGFMTTASITKLTDAFQAAFVASYDEEKRRKLDAKARLLAALHGVNEFAASTAHEEYQPS
ncbi:hypothetical protein ABT301_00840 [Streptomyces sp. NPDC000987]|uniref:hypothetical protein n=1 Tax=Streptomyces sp. NPDC000987 TaxID=3154374 RepID=UPI003316F354